MLPLSINPHFSALRKMYEVVQGFTKAVSQAKRLCKDDEATHSQLAQVHCGTDWAKYRCRQLTAFKMAGEATPHVSKAGKRCKAAKMYK